MKLPSLSLAVLAATLSFTTAAPGQIAKPEPTAPVVATAAPAPEEETVPDSPRASLRHYIELTRAGRHAEAAKYLDLPPERAEEGALLARRLKSVLDRNLWIDLSKVSNEPRGSGKDGLPPDVEEIGTITDENGATEAVRLVRRKLPEGTRWLFSRRTVSKVDAWYAELPGLWILERLPPRLLRFGPWQILWGQWIALVLLVAVSLALGSLMGWISGKLLLPAVRWTKRLWDDEALGSLLGPIRFFWTLVAFSVFVPRLGLYEPGQAFVDLAVRAAAAVLFFWVLLRLVDVVQEAMRRSPFAASRPSFRAMLPLSGRLTKLFLGALGVVAALSALGFPVASLLTGLGIGGVILALAAQKTVENLFGSLSIGADQPFGEGDLIEVDGVRGNVEKIGLRSTRIRTFDRTIVTIPNGKLADTRTESFAVRDRLRLTATLALTYGTTAGQMAEVISAVESLLTRHPKIWPGNVIVRFKELGPSSLNIEVMAWFQTPDWNEFVLIRQEVLLGIMTIVERAGTSFAFPSQTIYLANAAPPAPGS